LRYFRVPSTILSNSSMIDIPAAGIKLSKNLRLGQSPAENRIQQRKPANNI
jgi:hypothetical protein